MLQFTYKDASPWISSTELDNISPQIELAHRQLFTGSGPGSDFLGWLKYPKVDALSLVDRLLEVAGRIQDSSDVLVVIGIGGSYLGAKSAIDLLGSSSNTRVVFAGQNISSDYISSLLDSLSGQRVSVNVISKSGTTTEPAIAFRLIRDWLAKRYSTAELKERIIVTTDEKKGALRTLAEREGFTSFVVPDDIGGRYSVLTPVGLLPIAVAGIDIRALLAGAGEAIDRFSSPSLSENPTLQYAACRNILLRKGYLTEILVSYEPYLSSLAEWWKQLFGESEGKDGRGLFTASVSNTTDLHSLGQYIQAGRRFLFETVLNIEESRSLVTVPEAADDGDDLNYLAGRTLHEINQMAIEATVAAHVAGGVPNLYILVPERSAYWLGQLFLFFEVSCAISGYCLGVNPFDQPGVEDYKVKLFQLLGKPGFHS